MQAYSSKLSALTAGMQVPSRGQLDRPLQKMAGMASYCNRSFIDLAPQVAAARRKMSAVKLGTTQPLTPERDNDAMRRPADRVFEQAHLRREHPDCDVRFAGVAGCRDDHGVPIQGREQRHVRGQTANASLVRIDRDIAEWGDKPPLGCAAERRCSGWAGLAG